MTVRVPLYARRGWCAIAMVAGSALPAAAQFVPLDATGFNEDIIVEAALDPTQWYWGDGVTTAFDGDWTWYESGLQRLDETTDPAQVLPMPKGLPAGGAFTSESDSLIRGQFQPYGGGTPNTRVNNALVLSSNSPAGTLTLAEEDQQSYDALAVFASSGSGGGTGTLTVRFTDGTTSDAISYNAQDWFYNYSNLALTNLGRIDLKTEEDDTTPTGEPRIYQTVISLAALGFADKEVQSVSFTKPDTGLTAVFAISGLPAGSAISPIAASGWNRDLVIESDAEQPFSDDAEALDTGNGLTFYEHGLVSEFNEVTLTGDDGLPVGGAFTSASGSLISGQFQPYDEPNALFLEDAAPTGTLTLDDPAALSTLVVFATSTNMGSSPTGQGSLVLNFANSTSSETIPFNAPDWFDSFPYENAALDSLGRASISDDWIDLSTFTNPRIYQTVIDLEAAGLSNRTITSITFTKPESAEATTSDTTAIFAISGQVSDDAPPACPADRDGDGDKDVQDLLSYLRAFRARDADMDGDDDTDVQDLLGYLRAFRAGC